ncbi:uncharacterized protein LOC141695588 [Apium graveolens]|uniref:uncharacterized protein LOC141695588 n=1 Tax=Apium graveolens TaxID=4045 RepID=UPI003D79574B
MDRSTLMEMLREVQRGQNPTANGQDRDGQTMFDRFIKQRPNCFKEAKTPMDAEAWIDHMEKIFRVLECSEVEKARFATYHLEEGANTWWKSVFDQRYFPASIREEYVREYQSITQRDDESVANFQVRFQRLASYARSVAGSEVDKIMKFKWELKNSIRNHIISNHYTFMDTLVDSAKDQELHHADFLKKRDMQNQKRKREEEFFDRRHGFQKNDGSSGGFKPNDQSYGNAIILFDTGATHSFVSTSYAKHLDIASTALISDFSVGTPMGVTILVNSQYLDCVVRVDDRELLVDLLPIQMRDFDIILGMDWLERHKATIDCPGKRIFFGDSNSPEFVFQGSKPSGCGKFSSAIKAKKMIAHGSEVFLAHVIDTSKVQPKLEDVLVVREFSYVFPKDLEGLPPEREIEFSINLLPDAQPISKAP